MQDITNELLYKEMQAIKLLLESQKDSCALWDTKKIADYFNYSYEHTIRAIISDPDFPDSVKLQGRTGGRTGRRWIAGDVIAFARKRQKAKR